ncbi:hypothetical protein VFPFJ_11527 [Purpureocillium lilacinum]|uniref:Uncharacterized protein n=1 Tax=Purpureocillium lilacinum TaxID=33203 RepID=A0A179F4Q3_PURLI|nr:hypothetical protein VFPFJ_11527 [Purpureocillium lilacinum]OAQ60089.1 hypothetical protein VFPFJ_11527 [Purpureocillium lilacinum]
MLDAAPGSASPLTDIRSLLLLDLAKIRLSNRRPRRALHLSVTSNSSGKIRASQRQDYFQVPLQLPLDSIERTAQR